MDDEALTDDPLLRAARNPVEAQQQSELAAAWREVLDLPAGRRVIADLLDRCHLYDPSLPQSGEALAMAALEGERTVGLWVRNSRIMHLEPGAFWLLEREAQERSDAVQAADEKTGD